MNSLAKALARDTHEYKVAVPWKGVGRMVHPLRGNLIIALGAPGVGKSAFALNWALGIEEPSLLVSLDTDMATQALRAASIISGKPMDEIKKAPTKFVNRLETSPQVRKVRAYDIGTSPRDVLGMIRAEEEFWGKSPALTVVDNISNLVREGGYEDYRRLFVELHRVARAGDTCILALHHVGRQDAKGTQTSGKLTLWSGQYSGEQEAEIVLGLTSHDNTLDVSILKNRSGRADPSGALAAGLVFEKDKMLVREWTQEESAFAALAEYKQVMGT